MDSGVVWGSIFQPFHYSLHFCLVMGEYAFVYLFKIQIVG